MQLRPEEITQILKSRIEQYDVDGHGGTHGSPMSPLLRGYPVRRGRYRAKPGTAAGCLLMSTDKES